MYDAENHKKAQEQGITINEFCHSLELQRGKNLAIAAATVQSLERYVYSSLSASSVWSKGKHPNVCHFNSKAKVEKYIRSASEMQDLIKKTSFLQVGLYVDNWNKGTSLDFYVKDQSSGKWFHPDQGDGIR